MNLPFLAENQLGSEYMNLTVESKLKINSFKSAAYTLILVPVTLCLIYFFSSPTEYPTITLNARDIKLILTGAVPLISFAWFFTRARSHTYLVFRDIYSVLSKPEMANMIIGDKLVGLVLFALSAGISEELLFRGFVHQKFGMIAASLAFALFHFGNVSFFAVILVLGFYIGYFYELSDRNLFVPMALHFIYDLSLFILLKEKLKTMKEKVKR